MVKAAVKVIEKTTIKLQVMVNVIVKSRVKLPLMVKLIVKAAVKLKAMVKATVTTIVQLKALVKVAVNVKFMVLRKVKLLVNVKIVQCLLPLVGCESLYVFCAMTLQRRVPSSLPGPFHSQNNARKFWKLSAVQFHESGSTPVPQCSRKKRNSLLGMKR